MVSRGFDPNRKYVRVTQTRDNGLVEFQFAVGEPELFVELILPTAAFREFCAANKVITLSAEQAPAPDGQAAQETRWTLRDATHTRFRTSPRTGEDG